MKPGRELDVKVAEKVLGCTNFVHWPDGAICAIFPLPVGQSLEIYRYSTDIAAAFTVNRPGWLWEFQETSETLTVTLYTSSEMMQRAIRNFPILPKAVILVRREWLGDKVKTYAWLRCLAALEAVGVEVGDA